MNFDENPSVHVQNSSTQIHGSQRCFGPSSHSKTKHKFKKVDD